MFTYEQASPQGLVCVDLAEQLAGSLRRMRRHAGLSQARDGEATENQSADAESPPGKRQSEHDAEKTEPARLGATSASYFEVG